MNTVERVNSYSPGVTNVAVSGTGLSAGNANVYADGSWARAGATLASGNNSYTATAEDTYGRTAQDSVTMNLPATVAFTYDANGNLTGDGRRVFEYDYENQLTNVYVASAWRESMKYDAFGRKRLLQQHQWTGSAWLLTNEVRYVYDGMLVVQERHFQPQVSTNIPINTISYTRGNDLSGSLQGAGGIGGLLARTDHSAFSLQHSYFHSDGNGNITALVNTNGAVVARYQYDPYGNLLGMAGPLAEANTYRFSSKEWHANAGLYYYGFRYYEPNLQRWLNQDPIGERGGINLFGFVQNNSPNLVDPSGLLEWYDYINPLNWFDGKFWGDILHSAGTTGGSIDPNSNRALLDAEGCSAGRIGGLTGSQATALVGGTVVAGVLMAATDGMGGALGKGERLSDAAKAAKAASLGRAISFL